MSYLRSYIQLISHARNLSMLVARHRKQTLTQCWMQPKHLNMNSQFLVHPRYFHQSCLYRRNWDNKDFEVDSSTLCAQLNEDDNLTLIDVRGPDEIQAIGKIEDAVNIPGIILFLFFCLNEKSMSS